MTIHVDVQALRSVLRWILDYVPAGTRSATVMARKIEQLIAAAERDYSWACRDNPWYSAITDACAVNHMGWDDSDAYGSLRALIRRECEMSLDPSISSAAQELVDGAKTSDFDRTPETSRRMAAVKQLIADGWRWADGKWVRPMVIDSDPYGYIYWTSNGDGTRALQFKRSLPAHHCSDWGIIKLYTRPEPAAAVPNGWAFVPVEPSEEMISAGVDCHTCEQSDSYYKDWPLSDGDCEAIYKAMLAAVPKLAAKEQSNG
ncbi:MAG: hypothetical protein ABW154_07720 [Dyella sp.]